MTDDCVFCSIINGEIPSHTVYEDERTVAFLDANPVSKGHTLVVPREHVETIFEAEDMDYIWNVIVKVANGIRKAFDPEGMNIDQNNGELAGQEVPHIHFHLTPRYTGDELEISYDRKELEEGDSIAEKIAERV